MPPTTLSPWFGADVVAIVLAAVTLGHLSRQREESGAWALMVVAGSVIARALLDLVMVSTGSREVALLSAQFLYVPQVVDTLGWLAFAVLYAGQPHLLRHWGMAVMLVAGGFTTLLALTGDIGSWLVYGGDFVGQSGAYGFEPWFGPWKPFHQLYNWGGVIFATGIMALHVAQSPRHVHRLIFVLGAPLVAAVSNGLQVPFSTIPDWVSLQPIAHSFAAATLAFGLLRAGDLRVSPVARSIVVEEMEDGVVVLDRTGQIVDVNRSARERLGLYPHGEVPVALGTIWSSLKGKLLESRKPGAGRVDLEVAGQGLHTFAVSVTLLGPQGGQDRTVMVLRDITRQVITERELKAATLALHLLAHTDDLTTLANRRHFLDELSKEVDRSRRYGHSLSLIFLDLDHFKRVNDTYGHGMGDEVLQSTARAMESVCRDIDVAARMGGEEFAVLLPETDSEGARVVADRLRIEIAQRMHEPDGAEPFRVTASLGVATVEPGEETSVEELMQAADDALYDAKENGRNRVALSA